jgi:hypothetical protein
MVSVCKAITRGSFILIQWGCVYFTQDCLVSAEVAKLRTLFRNHFSKQFETSRWNTEMITPAAALNCDETDLTLLYIPYII